jgi:FkbM family methyltransferase
MPLKTKECRHGTFTYYDNDVFIGGALDRCGEYSEGEVQKLLSLIDGTSIVVEVGANIGAITVPLARRAKWVHAFEPQPEIYKLLVRNIEQNSHQHNVYCLDYAVGRKAGFAPITVIDYDKDGINTGAATLGAYDDNGAVQVRTLDSYCAEFDALDLIKIDVEGMEAAVIDGARKTINRLQPLLYVENDRERNSNQLIRVIMELGYRLYWHFPLTFNPQPMNGDKIVSVNMLCVPKDKIIDMNELTPIADPNANWRLDFSRTPAAIRTVAPVPRRRKTWAAIYRAGGVGDNLIAGAVLPGLKQKYDCVEVITGGPMVSVFENNPYIDKLSVQAQTLDPQNWLDFLKAFHARADEYDFFANLSHTVEASGALLASQTQYYWPAKMRRMLCGHSYLSFVADICDVPHETLAPNFFPYDDEVESAEELKRKIGGRYVGWVLSGTRIDKIWPYATIAVPRIIKELNIPVVIFGASQRDFDMAKAIEQQTGLSNCTTDGLHLACSVEENLPNWPIRRLLTQVQAADIVVSPDTGPAWACAMRPMPKIIMLSHATPENITKYWINTTTLHADPTRVRCWPCHLLIDEKSVCEKHSGMKGLPGAACISDINAETVVQLVKQKLNVIQPLQLAAE